MTASTPPPSGARDDLSGFTRTTPIACVMCEACGFTFDADHTDSHGDGYSCPACAEMRLEAENARLTARSEEGFTAHAASFGALQAISMLTDLHGEVDDYSAVVDAVARLSAQLDERTRERDEMLVELAGIFPGSRWADRLRAARPTEEPR